MRQREIAQRLGIGDSSLSLWRQVRMVPPLAQVQQLQALVLP
jgi:transcriptional regulator with XRE-family HTH domain